MTKAIDIFFILPNLGAGGAQRVISFVAKTIDKKKFNPTLVIIASEDNVKYDISGIPTVFLNKSRALFSIPAIFKLLKKKKPDVVVSTEGHINVLMATLSIFFAKTKFIGREVNVISILDQHMDMSNKGVPFLTKITYNKLDRIICQSNDMLNDLKKNYNLREEKLVVINNPISKNFIPKKEKGQGDSTVFRMVTVGRLAKQKGHHRILEALSQLDFPFQYTIIGDGPEKQNIQSLISSLQLANQVTHIPFTNNVADYLAKNDLFLQGSYVEGFPNALIESCAVGTPVLVFKALGGIDEIVVPGENGFVVENVPQYVEKIKHFRDSRQDWRPMDVSKYVYEKYNADRIIRQYENLFEQILANETD